MTDSDGTWRDEKRLPLREVERAVAISGQDGEADDVTGNDAGAEESFGHGPEAAERPRSAGAATDDQRAYRPSTTGRTGPH